MHALAYISKKRERTLLLRIFQIALRIDSTWTFVHRLSHVRRRFPGNGHCHLSATKKCSMLYTHPGNLRRACKETAPVCPKAEGIALHPRRWSDYRNAQKGLVWHGNTGSTVSPILFTCFYLHHPSSDSAHLVTPEHAACHAPRNARRNAWRNAFDQVCHVRTCTPSNQLGATV